CVDSGASFGGASGGLDPSRHTSRARMHRGWNGHPDGNWERFGTDPGREGSGPSSLYLFGADRSSAFVYGWRGLSKTSATGPVSTRPPAYMTPISSAISAMTPRSWLMNRIDVFTSFISSFIRVRT